MADIEVEYQEALDFLYKFVDYSLTRNLRYSAEKFDLGRMVALMEMLGNPHLSYPVVHVAGTKGKGSTAAMIASVLQAAGYKVGFYTSPHLIDFVERIQIDRAPISHGDLVEMVNKLKPPVARIERLTTFELTTAAAFLYFAREKVDIAVIEVGLGGRLDATNVVDPLVTVITSLSIDHTNVLGNTLAEIAAEKAGIIKTNKPVVISPQKKEALNVLRKTAKLRAAELIQAGKEYRFNILAHNFSGQTVQMTSVKNELQMDLRIPLLGRHQAENACTAFATLVELTKIGWKIGEEAFRKGFAEVNWQGRFEIISKKPLILLDSAHNRDSAEKLRTAIDDYFPGMNAVLLFGASEDKDVTGMFAELLPRMDALVATQSVHPRALEAEKLLELASPYGIPAEAVVPLEKALDRAVEYAQGHRLVVVTGSLFIVAGIRQVYEQQKSMLPYRPVEQQGEIVK